ncbi:MAG TPA: sigma-70 family RNA polymerase sigma factor [Actinomycetota bacterium]|nr:sigma-70 family RNA polymerase sigma factor [Actinomycetota bacterium]
MSDERLVRSAARGSADALSQLIESLGPPVFGYLQGMLPDDESAARALEETWVRLAKAVGRYKQGTGVTAWALETARRVVADVAPGAGTGAEGPPGIRAALQALAPEDRELLVCRDALGMDLSSVARLARMSTQDAGERLTAARVVLVEKAAGTLAR